MSEADEKTEAEAAEDVAGTPTEPSALVEALTPSPNPATATEGEGPDEGDRPSGIESRDLPASMQATELDIHGRETAKALLRKATLMPPSETGGDVRTSSPDHDAYIGCTIDDRYKVESVVAEGGMGVVYRGRHTKIDKAVALKILRPDFARDSEVTERFLTEAKAASAIGNVRIVDVFDFGQLPDGATYLAMELLEGDPLSARIKRQKPMPVDLVIHIAKQIAEALAAAHESGIVHRDLKPDNVFVVQHDKDENFIKILDFGIAKVAGGQSKLTRAGTVFGTPHYMSPEQGSASPVDHRTDIYSLGVILYEMTAGKPPFDAENPLGLVAQHLYEPPPLISEMDPLPQTVPPGLEAIILKCLSKQPENRYGSMSELIEELATLERGEIPGAVEELANRDVEFDAPPEQLAAIRRRAMASKKTPSRWPLYAGIGAFGVVLIAVLARPGSDTEETSPDEVIVVEDDPKPEATTQQTRPKPTLPAGKTVALVVSPIDARAYVGDRDLGTMPLNLHIPKGKEVSVALRRDGFYSETIQLDGKTSPVIVRMKAVPGAKPADVPDASLSEIVEKWKEEEKARGDAGVPVEVLDDNGKDPPATTEETPAPGPDEKDPPAPPASAEKPPAPPAPTEATPPKPTPPPMPPAPPQPKPELPKLAPPEAPAPKSQSEG